MSFYKPEPYLLPKRSTSIENHLQMLSSLKSDSHPNSPSPKYLSDNYYVNPYRPPAPSAGAPQTLDPPKETLSRLAKLN